MGNRFDDQLSAARSLFDSGLLGAAETVLRGIASESRGILDVWLLLGVIAARTKRPAEAASHLEAALQIDPNRIDALGWLAKAKYEQGEPLSAIVPLQKAIAQQPNDSSAWGLLGLCHIELGEAKLATDCFAKVIELEPRAGEGYFNLGMALRLKGDLRESADAFLKAVELAPQRPRNYLQAFKALQQISLWAEAISCLEEGRKRHPGSAILTEALAIALGRLNRPEEAEPLFVEAVNSDSTLAVSYANWLQEQGRFDDSILFLTKSIERNPHLGAAYRGLTEAKAFDWNGEPLLDRLIGISQEAEIDEKSRMHFAYAIAGAYDFAGDYQEAIRHYDLANDLAYRLYPVTKTFDPVATREDSRIMAEIYTGDLIDRMRAFGSSSEKPIFIIGMIRSGTTLLDQIVSSHPSVVSAGEQPFWSAEADAVNRRWREGADKADVASLAARYLSVLEFETGHAERVTDKMPLNFRNLGLIHSTFPNAKILHIRRDPLDTCLSIYTTFFAGGPNFTYHQENIAAYYRSYLEAMEHWRAVLSADRLYELDYEELVAEPENVTREVIDFCGLDWDDVCLSPQRNRAAVPTPSRWEARQPIYVSSVAKWRRYEPWLGALLKLKDLSRAL